MRYEDQEHDVAEPERAEDDYGLPQRTRTAGIWRHLPPRADPPDDATGDDEAAPTDEAVPAGPAPEIGRLVVAGDNRADANEGVPPDTDADPDNPIAAGELAHEPIAGPPVLTEPAADSADAAPAADAVPAVPRAQPFASEQWREIQASFVDDPRAAVQQAADAASAALTALVASLREQQASLGPAAAHDTEQLRAALQGYRRFCQALSDVGRMLPETAGGYQQQGSHQRQ